MKQAISHPDDMQTVLKLTGITLTDDETLVLVSRIHGAIYWKGVAIIIVGLLMLPFFLQNLGFMLLLVGAITLGLEHLTRKYLILAATDKRIFVRSGILYADMIELRYSQVESIELGIDLIGQIVGYGSVIVTGTGQRRIIVPFVSNAVDFRRRVNDILVNK